MVEVRLKPGISDPEGATIESALGALGFPAVSNVRVGKAIRFDLEAPDFEAARDTVDQLCEKLLVNPVLEEAASHLEVVA